MKKLSSILIALIVGVFSLVALLAAVHGDEVENRLLYQDGYDTQVGGPFEVTNSTSRYVLTQAMVDEHRFDLTPGKAQVASPDLVKSGEIYMSIFTPGVSFLAAPLYMLGKAYGAGQLGAYSLNILAAVLNVFLISLVARKLGSSPALAWITGLVFLFATNALVYSLTFTQHPLSTTCLLLSLLLARRPAGWVRNGALGLVYGAGMLIDIPNAFLLLPAILFALSQHIQVKQIKDTLQLKVLPAGIWLLLGLLPMLGVFGYYNYQLAGSPLAVGQLLPRYDYPNLDAPPKLETEKVETAQASTFSPGIELPFETRNQLEGTHILLISRQRSWIFYSPVVLLGVAGLFLALQSKAERSFAVLLTATVLLNVLLYSSFGDSWGGWAFGPRYLIPSAALFCACLGVLFTTAVRRRWSAVLITPVFLAALLYSVYVSSLGALTTAAIPPKGEAESLQNDTPWTTLYNQRMLERGELSSLLYNYFWRGEISTTQYLWYFVASTATFMGVAYLWGMTVTTLESRQATGKRRNE